ncbi:MAG: class I SAM-dependent methyltransferase [Deltaproteobacteria bacterium]|nr:class I SAM-dependent methyltransferase [Deltaproteobacteria bacterium]
MKFKEISPPREFEAGFDIKRTIKDCGRIELSPNEQVTFITDSGKEYDLTRKNFGFYATPSLNRRLKQFDLRAVLVKNRLDQFFILLVEKEKENLFDKYMEEEKMELVTWMDTTEALSNLDNALGTCTSVNNLTQTEQCPICSGNSLEKVFTYTSPPDGEISFPFSKDHTYYREYLQCTCCQHYISSSSIDLSTLYSGDYVASNYSDIDGIHKTFERIISLDPSQSDNVGRMASINDFSEKHFGTDFQGRTLLDVGSGLGVFPFGMKRSGWKCTAIDPDHNAVEHLEQFIGVKAAKGDFLTISDLDTFDVITFNKVLEHVNDPIEMLKKSRDYLKEGGFVYVEVPDGEMAALEGQSREEFFIDHLHVFSFSSITILAQKSGFTPVLVERVQEPSTKYTLRTFLRPTAM